MGTASKKLRTSGPSLQKTKVSSPKSLKPESDSTKTKVKSRSFLADPINWIYRFLASLKLAIVSLSALAIVLVLGMVFERRHGNDALQEYVYRTWWFGLMMAALGINILCAATIRFPWKRRQAGFVVTHAGLLVLLIGSWISFQVGDEGQLAMVEGDSSQTMVRMNKHIIRVREVDDSVQDRAREDLRDAAVVLFKNVNMDDNLDAETNELIRLFTPVANPNRTLRAEEVQQIIDHPALQEADNEALRSTLVRTVRRLQGVEEETKSYPLYPGPFKWDQGRVARLTDPDDRVQVEVTAFYPASMGKRIALPSSTGSPMAKVSLEMQPPAFLSPMDPLKDRSLIDGLRWIKTDRKYHRRVFPIRSGFSSSAPLQVQFQQIDRVDGWSHQQDHFRNLPGDGRLEVVSIYYDDNSGQTRRASYFPEMDLWQITGGNDGVIESESFETELPGSDLKVTYRRSGLLSDLSEDAQLEFVEKIQLLQEPDGPSSLPTSRTWGSIFLEILQQTEDDQLAIAEFAISEAGGPETIHWVTPLPSSALGIPLSYRTVPGDSYRFEPAEPLADLVYFHPPAFGEGMEGLKGIIDVLAIDDDRFFYRSINKDGIQHQGKLDPGDPMVPVFGGAGGDMKASFGLDEFVKSAEDSFRYAPINLPVGQAGQGIPAVRVELTVDGEKQVQWVRLGVTPGTLKQDLGAAKEFRLGRKTFEVLYDVDRVDLPYKIELIDFRRRFDPGTQQAKTFESDVYLTDPERGIEQEEVAISMNKPLSHRGYSFYQSSFNPPTDSSGEFVSVFQVRYDPTWYVVYLGCLMITLGIVLQFVMRSGLFTSEKWKTMEMKSDPNSTVPTT